MFRPSPGGAFEGLRVIDLAQVRSGPTCVKQFADFGADVIRIEPPAHSGRAELMTGARDGADMLNLHRNKRLMTLVDGEMPGQVGNDHPTGMPTSAYATADGHVNLGAGGEAMWVKLCEVLERPALATDPRFARGPERSRNRQALNAELGAIFRTRGSAEWIARLNAAGVPCGPIYRVDEVFNDPQVVAGGMAATVRHDTRGPIAVLAPTVTLSRTPGRLERSLPAVGQDTEDVLAELGYDTQAIADLRRDGVI